MKGWVWEPWNFDHFGYMRECKEGEKPQFYKADAVELELKRYQIARQAEADWSDHVEKQLLDCKRQLEAKGYKVPPA